MSSLVIQVGPRSVGLPSFEGLCGHLMETELEDHGNLEMLESEPRENLWMVWEEGDDEERGKTSGDGCWMSSRSGEKMVDADDQRPLCLPVAALWRFLRTRPCTWSCVLAETRNTTIKLRLTLSDDLQRPLFTAAIVPC